MTNLPDPLTPADSNLRSYQWFALDFMTLERTNFWITCDGATAKAFFNMMFHAYHEVPAGSLPDDQTLLKMAARIDEDFEWEKLKKALLPHWILCSDGRLYEPMLAKIVNEAWDIKLRRNERERERQRKLREKRAENATKKARGRPKKPVTHITT